MTEHDRTTFGPGAHEPTRLIRAKNIFLRVRQLGLAEREEAVDNACAGDAPLRELVNMLLHGDEAPLPFESIAEDIRAAGMHNSETILQEARPREGGHQPPEGPVASKIGNYRLLERLGEGGFGVVFMAEQEQPVRRRVALKIIKLGMDTRRVVARFEAERQALALMDHPGIAKVFDAGSTDTGRPYFVMELVRGLPITEYCDSKKLPIRARLELVVKVCDALQHAHQKGIIHRDIKPSNVLVTDFSDVSQPKIIDFGVAKATSARLTDKTIFTELRQMVGTPEYMSPEQASRTSDDIDTRADVYSVGVLLYELLTGVTPFESKRLRSAAYDEIQRIIREEEPPKPSTRLTRHSGSMSAAATARGTPPTRLGALIRGELDWIVMKAMDKERSRRYESAGAMARDVENYLEGRAVLAAPPSALYRTRKFARRHRGPVIAASLIAIALVAGIIATTMMYFRAEDARRDAVESARLAHEQRVQADAAREDIWDLSLRLVGDFQGQIIAMPGTVPAREAMSRAAVEHMERLADAAPQSLKKRLDLAQALAQLARSKADPRSGNTGDIAGALPLQLRALEIRREAAQSEPNAASHRIALAESLIRVGDLRRYAGAPEEAMGLYTEAVDLLATMSSAGESPEAVRPRLAAALAAIAECRLTRGDPLGALDAALRAQEVRGLLAEREPGLLANRNLSVGSLDLAEIYSTLERRADAVASFEQAIALRRELWLAAPSEARSRRDLAVALLGLSQELGRSSRWSESAAAAEEALALAARLVEEEGAVADVRHRQTLVLSRLRLAAALMRNPEPTPAQDARLEEMLDSAAEESRALAADAPAVADNSRLIAEALFTRGARRLMLGSSPEALSDLVPAEAAASSLTSLPYAAPADRVLHLRILVALGQAEAERAMGATVGVAEAWARAAAWFSKALAAADLLTNFAAARELGSQARVGYEHANSMRR